MGRKKLGIAAGISGLALIATAILAGPVAARDASKGNTFVGNMTGGAEVPPGDPTATGRAVITLKPSSDTVCFKLSWKGLTGVTASHIHIGAAGTSGAIVVPFFGASIPDTISEVGGCIHAVDPKLITDIHDTPGDYYVNVHDAAYPHGAIRAQLRKPVHSGDKG